MSGPTHYKKLAALPLTAERFRPFGDVLESSRGQHTSMNSARFERFNDLAEIDTGSAEGGRTAISIVRCKTATLLPYRVDMLERHPYGSQVFMPLGGFQFVVVVAPADETVDTQAIEAFVTNGHQGVNYHRGVWHMPMIGLADDQEFLVIDRAADPEMTNCDEHYLDEPLMLEI
jgi:ureidoglycolate lyase